MMLILLCLTGKLVLALGWGPHFLSSGHHCPHSMMAGSLQSEWFKRAFYLLASEVTHCHCRHIICWSPSNSTSSLWVGLHCTEKCGSLEAILEAGSHIPSIRDSFDMRMTAEWLIEALSECVFQIQLSWFQNPRAPYSQVILCSTKNNLKPG